MMSSKLTPRKIFKHLEPIVFQDLEVETLEAGRTYKTPAGKKYPSVTTVLGLNKDKELEGWRKRVGIEEANKIGFQAAGRGTEVHAIAEDYINNKEDWRKGRMPFALHNFHQIRNILDNRLDNVLAQEVPLYSDYLQTAGRVDLIAEFDGKRSIIDFKTSLRPKTRDRIMNYFQQEAFYAVAFEERTGMPISRLVTIIMVDGSEPQVFIEKRNDHIEGFMTCREEYRITKGI